MAIDKNDALPNDAAPVATAVLPASTAQAVVPLAGVPETPASTAALGGAVAAVPSSDGYVTEGSPNKATSSGDAAQPDEVPAAPTGSGVVEG